MEIVVRVILRSDLGANWTPAIHLFHRCCKEDSKKRTVDGKFTMSIPQSIPSNQG